MIQMLNSMKASSMLHQIKYKCVTSSLSHSQDSTVRKVNGNGGSPVNSPWVLSIMQSFMGLNKGERGRVIKVPWLLIPSACICNLMRRKTFYFEAQFHRFTLPLSFWINMEDVFLCLFQHDTHSGSQTYEPRPMSCYACCSRVDLQCFNGLDMLCLLCSNMTFLRFH